MILTQYLVYVDGRQQKVFMQQTMGTLLKEIRGASAHPSHTIITLDGDNGQSMQKHLLELRINLLGAQHKYGVNL